MKKVSAHTSTAFPWLYRSTVMCNQYCFYLVDADFGPLFIKFSSYFPDTARICLNGHEYAKRQRIIKRTPGGASSRAHGASRGVNPIIPCQL